MIPYKQLEKEYAKFCNKRYCVAVNSGTSALHLGLVALGIKAGDEVIVPDFTMAACGFAVAYTGAKVITVDCDDTLNIDVSKIEEKITPKTKAIMAVHIYGRRCNMDEINRIARKYKLKIIEDACEIQGASGLGLSDITCHSFYRNKIIHAEEGGAICTNNKKLYETMQDLKNMAFGKEHNYFHKSIGFNYRMPDCTANMVLDSLHNYKENAENRRFVEYFYKTHCKYPILAKRDAVWVYDFIVDNPEKIVKKNQFARYFFKPLSTMPMFKQSVGKKALYYSKHGAYYIVEPNMSEEDVINICKN
jgi:dTDP-4-amino-4,6-dideoxygalactose transaminase